LNHIPDAILPYDSLSSSRCIHHLQALDVIIRLEQSTIKGSQYSATDETENKNDGHQSNQFRQTNEPNRFEYSDQCDIIVSSHLIVMTLQPRPINSPSSK
jgi:hypothetical protein